MFDFTEPPRPDQRLLDVGCASGNFQSGSIDCQIVGLDEDPGVFGSALPAAVAERYHRVIGTAEEMPLAAGSFDYVLCHHILEHVAAPDRMLREIARVLKPGGGLSIAVPDGQGVCDGIYRYLFEGGGHVNRFRKDDVIQLVRATSGLHLRRWRRLYSSFAYISAALRLLDDPPHDLQRRLKRIGSVPPGLIHLAHTALYRGTRFLDRAFHSESALYGWAFYFDRTEAAPLELPALVNVCIHCGAGHPARKLRPGLFTYRCPLCGTRTPFHRPFGNAQ